MDIFLVASWVGSIAFATSGFLVGARKQMDVMGVFILTMLTTNGGGVIRDVLMDRTPAVLHTISAFILVIVVMLLGWALKLHHQKNLEKHGLFVLSDAIGLAAFSVTGALAGIEADLPIFGVMMLAFITATGGGILRDVIVNDVPAIFSSDFYGTVALMIGASLYGLHHMGWQNDYAITAAFVFFLAVRLLAYLRGWSLPRIKM